MIRHVEFVLSPGDNPFPAGDAPAVVAPPPARHADVSPDFSADSAIYPARIEAIDAARFVALLGIVFNHSVEGPWHSRVDFVGTFGVPFYFFASLYFQARSFRQRPRQRMDRYIFARIKRLYIPFVAWTIIYFLARNAKHISLSHVPTFEFKPIYLWAGTAYHLWFLPVLTVSTILTGIACRFVLRFSKVRWTIILASALAGTVLAIVPRPDWLNYVTDDDGYMCLQSWKALPSVFLGLALAWWMVWQPRKLLIAPAIGFAGVLLTAMMIGNQIIHGYSRMDRTLSGLGWLIAALADWQGAWIRVLARCGRYVYGMYLSHVLFVEGIQAFARSRGLTPSIGLDLITAAGGLSLAAITVLVISSTPRLRWLTGD